MKLSASTILFATLGLSAAFAPSANVASRSVAMNLVSVTEVTNPDAFTKPERIVMDKLPTLYVYDHCPFCVRVRVALGLKNVKHIVSFLANDDIPTPTALVGKKIAPIFVSVFSSKITLVFMKIGIQWISDMELTLWFSSHPTLFFNRTSLKMISSWQNPWILSISSMLMNGLVLLVS